MTNLLSISIYIYSISLNHHVKRVTHDPSPAGTLHHACVSRFTALVCDIRHFEHFGFVRASRFQLVFSPRLLAFDKFSIAMHRARLCFFVSQERKKCLGL